MKAKKAAKILTALAQETRIAIFRLLVQENESGLTAGKIAEILQVPAATLSFHLAQLAEAKLIEAKRAGRQIHYSARHRTLKKLYQHLLENAHFKQAASLPPEELEEGLDDEVEEKVKPKAKAKKQN